MKAIEIINRLNSGDKIEKSQYTKWKINRIVRGSYTIFRFQSDDSTITEKQFHAISIPITAIHRGVSSTVYAIYKFEQNEKDTQTTRQRIKRPSNPPIPSRIR